jgi:hypothetical protein
MEQQAKQQLDTIVLINLRLAQLRRVQSEITAESETVVEGIKRMKERVQQVEKKVRRKGWIF